MKLIKKGTIPASYCDSDVKLSVVGAFSMVEDLVTEMMGELKVDGLICRKEYGAMWVFVRNRMELRRDLYWKDEYTAECFISAIGKGKLHEDTVLRSADGTIALASRLELCAVDLETAKLRKMDTVGITGDIIAEEPYCEVNYARGKFVPEKLLETITVRSSDIDYLHHTNNISYIRYLVNQWSTEELSQRPIRAIEVQYAGQTYEGDRLGIWSCGGGAEPESAAPVAAAKSASAESEERFAILQDGKSILNCLVER